jgi:sulfofructose kinase
VEQLVFKFDVVGMGLNAVDHICVIPRFPRYDEKLKMEDFRRTVGGQVAKYIGKVGGDEMGSFSLSSLEEEGLDVGDVVRVEGALNQFAFILVDARTGERTIIWKRDARLAIEPEEVSAGAVTQGRFLLLDGHDAPAAARAAAFARGGGVTVVIDAESVKPGTEDVIRSAHYVVCSSGFPEALTGEADTRQALREMLDMGPRCVVATLGREGAICLSDQGFSASRGFRVECRDSTGAGDVFHGAFIYGLAQGWDIDRILDFSNAAAALNCMSIGARGGIRKVEEVFDLIKCGVRW